MRVLRAAKAGLRRSGERPDFTRRAARAESEMRRCVLHSSVIGRYARRSESVRLSAGHNGTFHRSEAVRSSALHQPPPLRRLLLPLSAAFFPPLPSAVNTAESVRARRRERFSRVPWFFIYRSYPRNPRCKRCRHRFQRSGIRRAVRWDRIRPRPQHPERPTAYRASRTRRRTPSRAPRCPP